MTRVAIVGPGRLGTLLAVAGARSGWRMASVGGGSEQARDRLQELVAGLRSYPDAADAVRGADLVLLAVPDDRLTEVATDLVLADVVEPGQRVVHLAGAYGIRPLRRLAAAGARVAACHPAMTVPAGSQDPQLLTGVAWAVTAAPEDRPWARELVGDLGGDPHDVAEDRRALYHAALAVGSNAVAAAVATARQLLLAAAVDDPAAFLAPLGHASVEAVSRRGAVALTGPIARGDVGTVEGHLSAIDADVPALGAAYRHLARATLASVRGEHPDPTLATLDRVLAATPVADPRPGVPPPGRR